MALQEKNKLSLAASYAGADDAENPRLTLEQQPVDTRSSIGLGDLEAMLAYVLAGVSAYSYQQPNCPVRLIAGVAEIDLMLWVWPVPLALDYSLDLNWGELQERQRFSLRREFELVVDFSTRIELPALCEASSWSWTGMPCFDRFGRRVERPRVRATRTALLFDREVFTVLRLSTSFVGWAHPIVLKADKLPTEKIVDIKPTVIATWPDRPDRIDQQSGEQAMLSATLNLEVPGCLADLLALCPNGGNRSVSGTIRETPETRHVVFFSTCDGNILKVKREVC